MTLLHEELIQDKLFQLKTHTDFLQDIFLKYSDKDIINETHLYYSLEHMLQLSIQIILDIGAHILAEEYHENPPSYAEVIIALGEHGIIEESFSKAHEEMAKFRNKLVHGYDTIEKKKVVAYGRIAPDIFRIFGKSYVSFIESKKPKI